MLFRSITPIKVQTSSADKAEPHGAEKYCWLAVERAEYTEIFPLTNKSGHKKNNTVK